MLTINPTDAVPIWKQIEDGIRRLVAAGVLPLGGAVPSVRDLARELRVNPATVVRAYQRLTEAGLLIVKRGDGTYVSDSPPALPKGERNAALGEGARRYASVAITVGAGRDEAIGELRTAFTELSTNARGGER